MNRQPIFDAVREMLGRGFSDSEVRRLDQAIDRSLGATVAHALADPGKFFAAVRGFTGALDQVQVDTVNRLLAGAAHWPLGWLAYAFATAWHEARFKPQPEWGKGRGRKYAVAGARSNGTIGKTYGGQIPYGRGLVQLTWVDNYEWADDALGLNGSLLADFDRALEPDIGARILIEGMEGGAFTGKGLAHYLPGWRGDTAAFTQSRRIINGTDKAAMIAALAMKFQDALEEGGWV